MGLSIFRCVNGLSSSTILLMINQFFKSIVQRVEHMECPVLPPFIQVLKIGAEDIPTLQANLFFQERSSMKTTEAQWEGMYI